jgi:lipid-binding SYLF domain-containing protein
LFAGISLKGATLRPDKDESTQLYGKAYTTKEIVDGSVAPPADAQPLLTELNRFSRHHDNNADRTR